MVVTGYTGTKTAPAGMKATGTPGVYVAGSSSGSGAVVGSNIVNSGGQAIGAANPHDATSYNPKTDPKSTAYDSNYVAPTTQATPAVSTAQPSPTTVQATPFTNNRSDAITALSSKGNTSPTEDQIGAQMIAAAQPVKSPYQTAADSLKGKALPNDPGVAKGMASDAVKAATPNQPNIPPTTPQVDNFFATNSGVQDVSQSLQDFLSPESTRNDISTQMSKLMGDQQDLSSEKLQLMNMNNIMAGTPDDIRTEITKANGFATNSQVEAMAVARNKTLLTQASFLQDQISNTQSIVANDTSLLNYEKDMANTQFTQRMAMLNYQQTNTNNMLNATKSSYDNIVSKVGYSGLLASMNDDPTLTANAEHILGLGQGGLSQLATQANTQQIKDDLAIQGMQLDNKQKEQNLAGSTGDKVQQKLEQDYRTILVKEVSSRSGTLGTEDAKVNQANHLASLINQYYDPKTGAYNVPKSQYGELVLGLAGMISKTGTPTDSQVDNINQRTAKGDLAGALTYITGAPVTGTTQAIMQNLIDSIDRQANTAVQNREAGLSVLRGLKPTDLDPTRAAALEKNTLVPYTGITKGNVQPSQGLVAPIDMPDGYYQASDGLLYKK